MRAAPSAAVWIRSPLASVVRYAASTHCTEFTFLICTRPSKFVNLDGRVQIKKVNSVQWVDAAYRTTLAKGDLIQTAADGAARITFADSTSYTIKPDTLVTVEENNVTRDQATTAVRVNTGAVDLSTPNWTSPNSHAAVSVEDTVAQI